MKELIEQFLNNDDIQELKIPMQPLNNYITIMKELGCEDMEQYETNGYSVDFWYLFKKNETKLTIYGNLWYSSEWSITKEKI